MKQLYKGANVFNCNTKCFENNVSILCENGRIENLIKNPTNESPNLETVDVYGKWIIPGMVNVHEHQTYKRLIGPLFGPGGSFFQVSNSVLMLRAIRSAIYSLRQGITTILEAGSPGDIPFVMRELIEKNLLPGPKMHIVGAAFSITGGHGCELCKEVDSPEEMCRQVRYAFKQGVDAIKLLASEEPVENFNGEPVIPQFSEEMIRVAVEEAHNINKKVSIHAMGTTQLSRSIHAGVDIINHGAFLNDELAAEMRMRSITLVPTLSSYRLTAHPIFNRGDKWAKMHEALWPAFDSAVDSALRMGVSIAIGTDSVGDFVHELQMLWRRGMRKEDCIVAATLNGAEALGIDRFIGSIDIGKDADFVVLDQNPVQDLAALNHVDFVVKKGVRYLPEKMVLLDPSGRAFVESFPIDEKWC